MVGLAKDLEGEPFHLIASYNQRGNAEAALHEIFQNGLRVTSTNVSATLQARHAGVRGTGYVPYYLVFDHKGDLVHHHQGGPYHGGDGKAVLKRVRKLLKDVPRIYLGRKPYFQQERLAERIESGKKLGAALHRLADLRKQNPDDAELKRLGEWVERHAARALREFERDTLTKSRRALERLQAAAAAYAGTPWGAALITRANALGEQARRLQHHEAGTRLDQALAIWKQLKPIRGNDGRVRNPRDPDFRRRNEADLLDLIAQLEQISRSYEATPAGEHAKRLLTLLR